MTSTINLEKDTCTRNAVLYTAVVISSMDFLGGEDGFILGNKRSDCNGIGIHNHLISERTHSCLAKLTKCLTCVVSTYLYGAFGCVFLSCHILALELIYTL